MLKRSCNGIQRTITCFHSLKPLILYSTSVASKDGIATPLVVEYLVKSIGFSEQEAVAIGTKVTFPFKSTEKSELVVDFLKRTGFDGTQIRKVVAYSPDVLKKKVDKTLGPKIRALQDLGFTGSGLRLIVSQHPYVLRYSINSTIVPVLQVLKSVLGSVEQVISFLVQIKSNRWLCKNLPANILLLRSYGLTSEDIKLLMLRRGFAFASTHWVEKILKGVEEKLGIPRTSGMFIHGISALTKKSEGNMEAWIQVLVSYGWSETEISELLRRNPLCLAISEKTLRIKLKYFMDDLGWGSDYLAGSPAFLTYSLEKRTLPRVAVMRTLKDGNHLKRPCPPTTYFSLPKSKFEEKFVVPYKDQLPELYENYTRATLKDGNHLKHRCTPTTYCFLSKSMFEEKFVVPYKDELPELYENYTRASTITCFHSLKPIILYSTSVASKDGIPTPLVVEYLVKSIGFSEQEAVAIGTKVTSPFKFTEKSELVVDFLKRTGFDGTQIRKVVAYSPDVLKKNVDKTLGPKIRALQDLGFSGSGLRLIVSQHPYVLRPSIDSSIVPVLQVLKSVMGGVEQLISFMVQIKSNRWLCKDLPANILLLKSYGLTSEDIKLLMLRRGFPFASTHWVEKILKGVEEKLGIPRTSGMFIHGISALSKKSEGKMEAWIQVLVSYGWSETEISELLRRSPLCLNISEKTLRIKLKYFMDDLGWGSDYLAGNPAFLSYSLEKRTLPRVAVMQTLKDGNHLKRPCTPTTYFFLSKSKFEEKFVVPYKDELPELYENYTRATLKDGNHLKHRCTPTTYCFLSKSMFEEKFVVPYKDELPELYENYTRAVGSPILDP
ncbi:hypothetical protein V2J09_012157 [Rumex salicifolius]